MEVLHDRGQWMDSLLSLLPPVQIHFGFQVDHRNTKAPFWLPDEASVPASVELVLSLRRNVGVTESGPD